MKNTRRKLLASLALAAALPLAAAAQSQPAGCSAKGNAPMKVKLATSMGDIVIQLDKEKAPLSSENFVKYVQSGHYDGTIFHRVIDGFMIQGGGFGKDLRQKPTQAPVRNEANNGLKNENYTVAMARTGDPHSATAQFFINVKDNDFLNHTSQDARGWGYTVFGKVVEGKDVVDKIKKVPVQRTGLSEAQPLQPVVIEKATCL